MALVIILKIEHLGFCLFYLNEVRPRNVPRNYLTKVDKIWY